MLFLGRSAGSLWLSGCLPWLAALWLLLALRKRSFALFAAHQLALAGAILAGTTVWLKHIKWIIPYAAVLPPKPNLFERIASVSHALLVPRNLQAYGVALGVFSMVWAILRIGDLRASHAAKNGFLRSPFSVDRCARHGIVALNWLIAIAAVLIEVPHESIRGIPPIDIPLSSTFGPTAWVLLGVLVLLFIITLWEHWRTAELISTLLLAATLPSLIAGQFTADLAVASAARWALSFTFAVCSVAVWNRNYLAKVCRRLSAGPYAREEQPTSLYWPRLARCLLIATTAVPVLALTLNAALLQIGGTAPAGPAAKTFFDNLGPNVSYLVPLSVLIVTLVGYALRERSSGYAFSAGLVLQMAVVLGYALRTMLAELPFDEAFRATLIELVAVTAGAWAILWLVARRSVDVWGAKKRLCHGFL